MEVTNVQIFPFKEGCKIGNIRALATIVIDDSFMVRGLRVTDGKSGLFVGYPNDPFYKGDGFSSILQPITRELREKIENAVLEAYQKEVKND